MKRRIFWKKFLVCMILFFWTPFLCGLLFWKMEVKKAPKWEQNTENIRDFQVVPKRLAGFETWGKAEYEEFAKDFLYADGKLEKTSKSLPSVSWYRILLEREKWEPYAVYYQKLLSGIKCFPVVSDKKEKEGISFEDSWGMSRSYGGKRLHEGTDLMPPKNQRDTFAVVSVCDGVVEKIGWLELGGYRIGIRSKTGTYFYYAHLSSYAEGMKQGKTVKAGELLGYMGDSGYGKEGTVGKFPVHLHFGIYFTMGDKEFSVNPYPILKAMEKPLSTARFL